MTIGGRRTARTLACPSGPCSILVVAAAMLAVAAAGTRVPLSSAARTAGPLTVRDCGTSSSGPGALRKTTGQGAACLLSEFQHRCRPARYELSRFGVDTVASVVFTLASRSGHCQVDVKATSRVIPQTPRVTGHGVCGGLRRHGKDIVAYGCKGPGLAGTISLTGA
jgi:hypothetical protein